MFQVFIVDDEALARDGLRTHLEREYPELNVCGEAADGESAWMQIIDLKPDILLLDIQIPRMDGIGLARRTKKALPWIQIIIISGYEKFEYARSAVRIGVSSYLLKPIDWKVFKECMREAEERIEESRNVYQNLEVVKQEKRLFLDRFLSRLVTSPLSREEMQSFEKTHGLSLSAEKYLVCRLKIREMTNQYFSKLYIMGTQLFEEDGNVLWFIKGGDCFVYILTGGGDADLMEEAYQTAQTIQHELEELLKIKGTIGIGTVVSDPQDIPSSYRAAKEVTELFVDLNSQKIISFDDYQAFELGKDIGGQDMWELELSHLMRYAKEGDAERITREIYSSTMEKNVDSLLLRFFRLFQLLTMIQKHTKSKAVLDQLAQMTPSRILETASSYEKTEEMSVLLLRQALPLWIETEKSAYRDIIWRAEKYVEENYADHNISLSSAAKEIGFSANHFSTVFSQETGQTFVEYLTNFRIQKAKQLICQGEKLSNIAFRIGYNDPSYFSYVFKKKVGLSPRNYRKQEEAAE